MTWVGRRLIFSEARDSGCLWLFIGLTGLESSQGGHDVIRTAPSSTRQSHNLEVF